ncbi:Asp/Glu racemase [Rhizobium sp. Root708]|uniref:aspartate/glutamate racemase family protein n=1 Tax=Rhizobium sp. Root708 TaxID=1736592 RepID=UPI0006F6420D|nr:aspartate/glutamate racemase family protein [Rhizobium sp. Root708]KRB58853.1 Asp/Glu racemase [Rhizobium sp. Root708]
MRIACLHTADSNIAVFEAAAREIGLSKDVLSHAVRADLLAGAERAGGLTDDIARETASVLRSLGQTADAVVLTCSTLGPSVDEPERTMSVPTLRVDAALAEQAVQVGGRIVVLCAVETTLEPTARLFAAAVAATQTPFEVRLVPGAWDLFKTGDRDGYLSAIAEAADAAYREGATIVALAQASMAGAADLVKGGPRPLSSPAAGLAAAVEMVLREA